MQTVRREEGTLVNAYVLAGLLLVPCAAVLVGARIAFRAWIRLLFHLRGFDADPFGEGVRK